MSQYCDDSISKTVVATVQRVRMSAAVQLEERFQMNPVHRHIKRMHDVIEKLLL